MATLSSAIVKQQVASMHDVEEALARQVLYGGDLATNLLETASLSEARLTAVIAQCHGMAPAPAGQLPRPSPGTLRLVPGEIAVRHGIYPIGERPGELWVAVAEPIPAEVENDLAFALGVNVVQFGALLVRVREAIARDYGSPLDRRLERLLGRLEGSASGPSEAPRRGERRPASGTLALPRPDTLPPKAFLPEPVLHVGGRPAPDTGPLRAGASTPRDSGGIVPAAVVSVTSDRPPTDLDARPSPPDGAAAPAAAPRGTTPTAGVTSVASHLAGAGDSESTSPPRHGDPPTPIPLTRLSGAPTVSAASDLPAVPPVGVALAAQNPASVRPRVRRGPYTVAMAEQDLQSATTRDEILRACFDFCAQYFEYTAVFTVQADVAEGRDAQGPGADRLEITRVSVPLDRAGVFATARQSGTWVLAPLAGEGVDADVTRALRRPSGKSVLVLPVVIRERCVLLLWGDHGDEGVELGAVGDVIAFVALTAAALERVILKRKRSARRAVAVAGALESMRQPLARSSCGSDLPPLETRASALTTALAPGERASSAALPAVTSTNIGQDIHDALTPAAPPAVRASWTEPVAPSRLEPSSRSPVAAPSGGATSGSARHPTRRGVAPQGGVSLGVVPVVAAEAEALDRGWELERATGGARAPVDAAMPARGSAPIDGRGASGADGIPAEVHALIERLVRGDTSVSERLLALGEPAMAALVAALPGPMKADPRTVVREGVLPSRCGPVLEVLTRFGRAAVPSLEVRSADTDATVRAWTVRLLGELGGVDAARAVARRADDADETVRQAALAGARLLHQDAESRVEVRSRLQAMASDPQRAVASRLAALDALGNLRDASAIPGLVALLADGRPEVLESAQRALVALAFHDLGRDAEAWQRWWERSSGRHRVEWMIDALTHEDQQIRHRAGEELKQTTREYFGYYDDLPRQERVRAQQRYREWWESRGRAIFAPVRT